MNIRVLVADDDPLIRVLVVVSLADIAETVEAADGDEVLRLLGESEFDLVLLDWDMPGPDGMEVLKALRARGSRMPIIMVTAKAERVQVLRAIHAGASDYVIKPFATGILREKVERFCRSKPTTTVSQPMNLS
jgi:two-component system, chemotaxis family, chemotaxis protein CheY